MIGDPFFWLAFAWALSPVVALRIVTGKPTARDIGATLVVLVLRIVEAFVPRKGGKR